MITFATIEAYMGRVEVALNAVNASIVRHEQGLKDLIEQKIALSAQSETLRQLANIEEAPPVVEIPFAGPENIEDKFEDRLNTFDGTTPEENFRNRQDNVYRGEALETVEVLDEANRAESPAE